MFPELYSKVAAVIWMDTEQELSNTSLPHQEKGVRPALIQCNDKSLMKEGQCQMNMDHLVPL